MAHWQRDLDATTKAHEEQQAVVEQIQRTIEEQKELLNKAKSNARYTREKLRQAKRRYYAHMNSNEVHVGPFLTEKDQREIPEFIERWTPVWDYEGPFITDAETLEINGEEVSLWKRSWFLSGADLSNVKVIYWIRKYND